MPGKHVGGAEGRRGVAVQSMIIQALYVLISIFLGLCFTVVVMSIWMLTATEGLGKAEAQVSDSTAFWLVPGFLAAGVTTRSYGRLTRWHRRRQERRARVLGER